VATVQMSVQDVDIQEKIDAVILCTIAGQVIQAIVHAMGVIR